MSKKPFYLLIFLLFASGLSYNIYRHHTDGIPLFPGSVQTTWTVEARVTYTASGAVEASLALPSDPAFTLLSESAASPGYGLAMTEEAGARRATWTTRDAQGRQELYYTANLVPNANYKLNDRSETMTVPNVVWDEGLDTAATAVIEKAWEQSANNRSFARQLAQMVANPDQQQNVALLLGRYESGPLLNRLLHSAKVPSKLVYALNLEDGRRRQQLQPWVEVQEGDKSYLFNPRTGAEGRDDNVLLWQRHGNSVLDLSGGSNSNVTFSMIEDSRPALATAIDMMAGHGRGLSLYNLPLEEQSLLRGLFLIPIGVLVVVFLRVLIGLKTSGTFMPVLIALAFIQTKLLTGLIGFLLIVACGLVIRSYLSNLNLLLISRISAVVILVLGIIAGFTLLAFNLGLTEGLTITFFPMIILAWTIERMSILWEEEGPKEVMIQGGGSLLVAVITYLAMDNDLVRHWAFNFLGIHLIIVACILLMGQYTGYRLLELRRFRPLAEDK
ncbi:inactive transglutaminase family protein [Ferrimonas marina]|uniref:Inactive transglutaminase fused to 7 transmembrane helices n=1 Tax=Ferrimonas marina TaxID=299255 RepID=A0A1M5N0B7_9GAMM|nr:inactive transglutaminase family protein [Ferrimonas marina]SHG82842.1 Inactive transglutaminase fused to 7 transmembrane helices [Ferrimonas marina]